MRKLLKLTLCFFLISCGYKPIFVNESQKLFEFYKINLSGDEKINSQIVNSLKINETNTNKIKNQLFINSEYKIYETSKNSKGLVETYRSSVSVNFSIKEEDKIIEKKYFNENFSYNNLENRFELIEYQNIVKNNLINKIIEDIILFMNIK